MRRRKRSKAGIGFNALDLAFEILEALNTPVSLGAALRLKYGEYTQLVNMEIDPLWYNSSQAYFLDRQSVSLLAKYPNLDTGIDTQLVAAKKFIECESRCRDTNDRFRQRSDGVSPFPSEVERVLFRAQQKIADILGPVPLLEDLQFGFGPGASLGVRGDTSVYKKLTSALECNFAMLEILPDFLAEFPGWIPSGISDVFPVRGSELTFVPKNAKTDRPICIEPTLSGLYQKGVGSYLRSRLARVGVNLRDQGVNQGLARLAIERELATVDFTSASDMIAHSLVLEMLPIDWFELLNVARSPRFRYNNRWYSFEKFSSMGNAYTFELESLIYFALATSCCYELGIPVYVRENLHVFGDDVILPREAFDLFVKVTETCGFEINRKKSYSTGVFFESCGSDFFGANPVRPWYLKKDIKNPRDAYYATNEVLRLQKRLQDATSLANERGDNYRRVLSNLARVHRDCIARIPSNLRYLVPDGQDDVGLISDFDVACPAKHRFWCGYRYIGVVERGVKVFRDEWPMSYALYHAQNLADFDPFEPSAEPVKHSVCYTLSRRTKLRKATLFHFGPWPLLPNQWSKGAIKLVPRKQTHEGKQPDKGEQAKRKRARRARRSRARV